jgi:hypothetical protein
MKSAMQWMQRALVAMLFALLLALPGQALALTIAPPGKSGADQYFETIPTSTGNAAPPGSIPGSSGGGSRSLAELGRGRTGAARLARLGKDGTAAAALAAATVPQAPSSSTGGKPESSSANPNAGSATATGGSATSGLSRALTGSDEGGLGLLLPLLLATTLLAAIGVIGMRLRRRGHPPELGA